MNPLITADDGVRLYYEETGAGTAVLFVHEFAGDHRSWEPQLRHFSRRYRCIAYNARGYPPSDVPQELERYSQARARDDIRCVLDALGIQRAHVVGLSMGAFATLHFGMAYGYRALSLTIAGCGYGAHPAQQQKFQEDSRALARLMLEQGMAHAAATYGHGPARVQLQAKNPRAFADFARHFSEHSAQGSANTMLGYQARRPSLFALVEEMARIDVPALIVAGDEDEGSLEASRSGDETAFHLRSGRQTMSLKLEKRAGAGWIVFDNPGKRNAINGAMWRGIPEAMARFDADREVRCVAFRGAGAKAFSAGADISEFDKARAERGSVAEYDDLLDRVLHSIQGSPKPSVAMIHGFCLGGGLEVALACDLRYCGESAQFGIPAAKLGLAYNVEGHKRLLETVGHARTREIMFLGRRYSAAESLAMGLVHQVFPDAELENAVGKILQTLCENAPLSIANTRTILEEYVKSSGAPDAGRMRAAIERCAKSDDYKEGRRAFMEKRKPRFEGK